MDNSYSNIIIYTNDGGILNETLIDEYNSQEKDIILQIAKDEQLRTIINFLTVQQGFVYNNESETYKIFDFLNGNDEWKEEIIKAS